MEAKKFEARSKGLIRIQNSGLNTPTNAERCPDVPGRTSRNDF